MHGKGGMCGKGGMHDGRGCGRGHFCGMAGCDGGGEGACVVRVGHAWQGWGRRDGHCSGRYASYWNAFLYQHIILNNSLMM